MEEDKIELAFEAIFKSAETTDLRSTTKNDALKEMVEAISKSEYIQSKEEFEKAIFEREQQLSTGVGIGVAIPHVKIPSVTDFVAAIGRSHRGIEFHSIDNKPVHLIVMIGASDKQSGDYLKILARIVLRLKHKNFLRKIMLAKNADDIRKLFLLKPSEFDF